MNTTRHSLTRVPILHYRPHTAIVTSIEFDHADIYRDLAHCQGPFSYADIIPEDGCLVARWDDDAVVDAVGHNKLRLALRQISVGQRLSA